jgi:type II secretion system protein D
MRVHVEVPGSDPLRSLASRSDASRRRTLAHHAGALIACAGLAIAIGGFASVAAAQADPAEPAWADPALADPARAVDAVPASDGSSAAVAEGNGRRAAPEGMTVLAFKSVTVDQLISFMVETTGKVVYGPPPDVLTRRITVLNDRPIAKREALDFVVTALLEQGVAVVELDKVVRIRDITEIDRMGAPVLGPERSLRERTDHGAIVQKVFALKHGLVTTLNDPLKAELPQWAKFFVDPDSNQIIITANIATLQRIEQLLETIDRPSAAATFTETFFLANADAEKIKDNINELFNANQGGNRGNNNNNNNPIANFFRGGGGGGGGGGGNNSGGNRGGSSRSSGGDAAATSVNLRVTANNQQNSVTVVAERAILDQVRTAIRDSWDKPVPAEATLPKIYSLKHSDPVKVRDLLAATFGNPGSGNTGGGGGGGGNQNTSAGQTANRLFGQFTFEAIPESAQVLVIAKSPSHMAIVDRIVDEIDQPQSAGLPHIVELKHAQAEELAEQLNALLAQEGTLAAITRSESGLTTSATSSSPFATTANQSTTGTTTNQNQQNQQQSTGTIQFWWQRARTPTNTAGSSNLVSKIRIVPVWRRNALMVLSPPEYHASLGSVIEALDRPGRQVLLSAVIAEISIDDALNLGLRWSSSAITPANGDNSLGIGAPTGQQSFTGQKNDLIPGLFDTSVLNVGANVNVLLQALNQKTAVNILSEPRIFTSDNQQAEFFSGQDIPFITQSQTNTQGNLVQSFDYRAVGIALRVRPRITVNKDVDLRINLELSSIQPNQTLLGGFIVDRRETTTQLIVRDGQTVVVSGILRTQDQDTDRKVPLLGDIPLVGNIFKSTEKRKSKTELVAFVTPYVINNTSESDELNAKDRERLGELREELRPAKELDAVSKPRSDTELASPEVNPSGDIESAAPVGDAPVRPEPARSPRRRATGMFD